MSAVVKLIKLNNLQYNANRDPEIYRRAVGESFRLQTFLAGNGNAKVSFVTQDNVSCEQTIQLPGVFECQFSYDSPGSRVGRLTIASEHDKQIMQDIRIDVREHAWIG